MDRMEEFRIPKEAQKKLKDVDFVRKEMAEGKTLKEIIGYPEEVMEKFYGAAYNLFQVRDYERAADAFLFLTTLDPYVYNYWLGLGMSEQLKEEFQNALVAYGMAAMIDSQNPVSHFHSATCYQALDNLEDAKASLELAITFADEKEEYAKVKRESQEALQRLNRKRS